MLIAFNKPYGVLSQFSGEDGHPGLSLYKLPKGVYACGRLDRDSEGLLILSDDGKIAHKLTDPRYAHPRTYWAQVERVPTTDALEKLAAGPKLGDGPTRPCRVKLLAVEPKLPDRDPPVRHRLNVPTSWLELTLTEGRNRQVRRMTAAVSHPTLRLVRVKIGRVALGTLQVGAWRNVDPKELRLT